MSHLDARLILSKRYFDLKAEIEEIEEEVDDLMEEINNREKEMWALKNVMENANIPL